MTNCHTRWNSMWIHNNVRSYSVRREGHILMSVRKSNGTLLSVT